ncbi:unnamed protein product, partial [Amoebophrya sp. A25]|eukprot:GSA25T00005830001.1
MGVTERPLEDSHVSTVVLEEEPSTEARPDNEHEAVEVLGDTTRASLSPDGTRVAASSASSSSSGSTLVNDGVVAQVEPSVPPQPTESSILANMGGSLQNSARGMSGNSYASGNESQAPLVQVVQNGQSANGSNQAFGVTGDDINTETPLHIVYTGSDVTLVPNRSDQENSSSASERGVNNVGNGGTASSNNRAANADQQVPEQPAVEPLSKSMSGSRLYRGEMSDHDGSVASLEQSHHHDTAPTLVQEMERGEQGSSTTHDGTAGAETGANLMYYHGGGDVLDSNG